MCRTVGFKRAVQAKPPCGAPRCEAMFFRPSIVDHSAGQAVKSPRRKCAMISSNSPVFGASSRTLTRSFDHTCSKSLHSSGVKTPVTKQTPCSTSLLRIVAGGAEQSTVNGATSSGDIMGNHAPPLRSASSRKCRNGFACFDPAESVAVWAIAGAGPPSAAQDAVARPEAAFDIRATTTSLERFAQAARCATPSATCLGQRRCGTASVLMTPEV
mmetsp:Transcript_95068/g.273675  ORF Transcript_95068/g.273675 Transcript_95068/m.273675 type:complete len:214 (+) Transcript_95068:386-1027(+)